MNHFVAKNPRDIEAQCQEHGVSIKDLHMVGVDRKVWCFWEGEVKKPKKDEPKPEAAKAQPAKPESKLGGK